MPVLLDTHALISTGAGVLANAEPPTAIDDTVRAAPTAPIVIFFLLDTADPFRKFSVIDLSLTFDGYLATRARSVARLRRSLKLQIKTTWQLGGSQPLTESRTERLT